MKILVGCPFSMVAELERALVARIGRESVIGSDKVVGFDTQTMLLRDRRRIKFSDLFSSFMRYPYDLIPPHSKNFADRERTETFKSLALMCAASSVNEPMSAWAVRNRLHGLSKISSCGANVPSSFIASSLEYFDDDRGNYILKAVGNCFVTDDGSDRSVPLPPFFETAEDDGDFATIMPAQPFVYTQIAEMLALSSAVFVQSLVVGAAELRVYYVFGSIFFYKRLRDDSVTDQSSLPLVRVEGSSIWHLEEKLANFSKVTHLRYFCIDGIILENGEFVVVDVNPFGSFPDDHTDSGPVSVLAESMTKGSGE